ncbi:MAG: N-formylglutamate amidohydrolase [Rhodospirillales bacterium]
MWEGPAFAVDHPVSGELPLVVASPHSGSHYPLDMLDAASLSPHELRRSEDCHVQMLIASAPSLGATTLQALFPRAYVDPNREPYELDPLLFDEDLPDYANSATPRVAAGLGTLARIVASGRPIYRRKLSVAEALERIERCYIPYHQALRSLIDAQVDRFGFCLLLDCHSMPSLPRAIGGDSLADIVLGDCHGTAASPGLVEQVQRSFRAAGYKVAYNAPYAGGFITRQYGRPERGVLTLQIELARALYMDEESLLPSPGFSRLYDDLHRVFADVAAWTAARSDLPRAAE